MKNSPRFVPNPDQMAHQPNVTGNEINGMGEEAIRRPSVVYWADDTSTIAHGQMQEWFYQHNTSEVITKARAARTLVSNVPTVPVAKTSTKATREDHTRLVKDYAFSVGAGDVGIAAFDAQWSYDTKEVPDYKSVIVFALPQQYDEMATAPDDIAGAEVIRVYGEGTRISLTVMNWIRERGYPADISSGPMAGPFTMIPAAIAAGLGELGKHGSLIHPKFGSNFRLSTVMTNMPLNYDTEIAFGADGFCHKCQICSRICEVDAIEAEKQWVRGSKKWYVDFDKCLPFFNEHAGCSACMIACPWSRPDVGEKMLAKLVRNKGL